MAKGTGLIGNFKGKVGNTVGYKLSASNNGQTQGIRVYQPIVKNPKTAAQAEQRAKLLAVNATYRALKMVIDRGNEGQPYGNKSRLAWLKGALKAEKMPWFEKGAVANYPVLCPLTKGSLAGIQYNISVDGIDITIPGVSSGDQISTVGALSTALMAAYSNLKAGDQVTLVFVNRDDSAIYTNLVSFTIDTSSDTALNTMFSTITVDSGSISFELEIAPIAASVIISRLGDNGEHLRSTEILLATTDTMANTPYDADSKAAAIASYQSSGYVNADWQEEAVQ